MDIKVDQFLVNSNDTISDAFKKIDNNLHGIIFIQDNSGKVIGVATDGDIRRGLLADATKDSPISECMNRSFVSALDTDPREKILKLLDNVINVIPVLDEAGKLCDIVTKKFFPIQKERRIVARAKSPVRISFGGGGTDLTHYFLSRGGVVLNSTINMYSHASLRKRNDGKIIIDSHDLDKRVEVDSIKDLFETKGFELISAAIELIKPEFGFELEIHSDFPVGSGLGGSSVVLSTIFGCFNHFREDRWDNYEIAEMAFQAERIFMDMAGGWQDQYATVFGGFNFMEFNKEGNVVHPLRIPKKTILELEENLILCHTKIAHQSGNIHDHQKKEFKNKEEMMQKLAERSKDLTYQMKADLLKGKLRSMGKKLDEMWRIKRQFSDKISDNYLDEVYQCAYENGALGGKLLGAGGGGYFLFYVEPFKRLKLIKALGKFDIDIVPVRFDNEGLQSWTVRDK